MYYDIIIIYIYIYEYIRVIKYFVFDYYCVRNLFLIYFMM